MIYAKLTHLQLQVQLLPHPLYLQREQSLRRMCKYLTKTLGF